VVPSLCAHELYGGTFGRRRHCLRLFP
jgi:hypothetical protein